MSDHEIASLLQKKMGLESSSVSKTTLVHAVRRRMRVLALDDKDVYVEKLKSSVQELQELIEEVVIPETWFFRGREPFEAMIQFLENQWAPKHRNTLLKILSVPCSTGEEPYSITMSLLDSGWKPDAFEVHGVDISHRAIARAREGNYSKNSFRGPDLTFRSRHFTNNSTSYCLNKNIRAKVNFQSGNVLDSEFMKGLGTFDIIFFRNILIYFNTLCRQQAVAILDRMLADDGLLFVGHAEVNLFGDSPFKPFPYRQAFAFCKKNIPTFIPELNKSTAAEPVSIPCPKTPDGKLASRPKKSPGKKPDLELARKLANKGKLEQATAICEKYLEQYGPSVQALFLLGIISNTADDIDKAEKLFRKALYLDPNNEEILVFLLLLAEKKGDTKEVRTLNQRIKRVQDKKNLQTLK